MKNKPTLPQTKIERRPRRNFETTQKKDRDAIDAAFKRKIGDNGLRPRGEFGRKKVEKGSPAAPEENTGIERIA